MKIYHGIEDFKALPYAVVTSGTFDGVHLGHQKILSRLQEIAKMNQGETVLITFWPHPRLVLYPDQDELRLLNTFEEKADLLRDQGVDHLLRIPFTKAFSKFSSKEFVQTVLVQAIGTKKLVIGYDHRFGRNREGSFEHLKENSNAYGFEVEEIPKHEVDRVGVSSSKIREALATGDVKAGSELLGQDYSLRGRVINGDKIGRMLGYPTANIQIDSPYKLIPKDGAYAVYVKVGTAIMKGMLNIGYRPTVGGKSKTVEVHIFDFENDIYGESITVFFHQMIRNELHFADVDELRNQLKKDKKQALNLLAS
ncbi:MAG: bifunctional riboflavin kinase/FAD synthetase [Bacteroidota bacterium]